MKYTITNVSNYLDLYEYRLISIDYKKTTDYIKYICPEGHIGKTTFHKFKLGRRCPLCNNKKQSKLRSHTYEYIQSKINNMGYTLLSTNYINNTTKLDVLDSNNNKLQLSYKALKRGVKSNYNKRTTDDVRKIFKDNDCILLTLNYKNNKTNLKYICSCGNLSEINLSSFLQGHRCKKCRIHRKNIGYNTVKRLFNNNGYTLLTLNYNNNKELLEYKCPNGHLNRMTYSNFLKGHRCPSCFKKSSKAENDIFNFINKYTTAISNTYNIIAPYELDIYLPTYKIAIEYCGLYWHSDKYKSRNYHRMKLDLCNKQGIRLITIFEDEWINQRNIVTSRLLQILGKTQTRIFARKCEIRELYSKQANEFYVQNHLQGATRGKLHVGLFYNDELVQAMTIGSPSRAHTNSGLELKRLATKCGYSVVGGTGKLFKYCLSKTNQSIRSHNDLRWGKYTDNVYEKMMFTKLTESKYTPHYIKGQSRYRNQGLCKTKAERLTGKTEWELRSKQGYSRIWDCGHQTWEYNNEKIT